MRLVGLALFSLLVMGLIQFAFWADEDTSVLATRMGNATAEPRVTHDLNSAVHSARTDTGGDLKHAFVVRERDTWTSLAGSPGYHKARFNLPKDVRVESGVLLLDLTSQLQAEGIARLRVNINGERRGEIILPEGQSEHTVRVNLLPTDLTSSVLEVNLAAQGRFPQVSCSAQWNGGIVVRVEPSSRVELTTTEPLKTLEDRLRATGDPSHMIWPDDGDSTELARLLRFAASQSARGARSEFVSETASDTVAVALSAADLDATDAIVAQAPTSGPVTWPIFVAKEDHVGRAKFFEYSTDWEINYDLRGTPNAQLPTHLDLDMSLVGLHAAEKWMLSVMLNGRAIHTERLENSVAAIKRSVALPTQLQGFSNLLEVRLINSEPQNSDGCVSGVPVMAQLELGTKLRGGVYPAEMLPTTFINALPDQLALEVDTNLNAAEATAAVQFMADAFGDTMRWVPVADIPKDGAGAVRLMWRNEIVKAAETLLQHKDREIWLVWPKLVNELSAPYGLVHVTAAEDIAHYPLQEGARIAALVSLPKGTTAPEAEVAKTTPIDPVVPQAPSGVEAALPPAPKLPEVNGMVLGGVEDTNMVFEAPTVAITPWEVEAVSDNAPAQLAPVAMPVPTAGTEGYVTALQGLERILRAPSVPDAASVEAPQITKIVIKPEAPLVLSIPAEASAAPTKPVHPAFLPAVPVVEAAPAKPAAQPAAKPARTAARVSIFDLSERPSARPSRPTASVRAQRPVPATRANTTLAPEVAEADAPLLNPLKLDADTIVTLSFQGQY